MKFTEPDIATLTVKYATWGIMVYISWKGLGGKQFSIISGTMYRVWSYRNKNTGSCPCTSDREQTRDTWWSYGLQRYKFLSKWEDYLFELQDWRWRLGGTKMGPGNGWQSCSQREVICESTTFKSPLFLHVRAYDKYSNIGKTVILEDLRRGWINKM